MFIQTDDEQKYVKPNVEPDQLASFMKDFKVMAPSSFGLLFIASPINCHFIFDHLIPLVRIFGMTHDRGDINRDEFTVMHLQSVFNIHYDLL